MPKVSLKGRFLGNPARHVGVQGLLRSGLPVGLLVEPLSLQASDEDSGVGVRGVESKCQFGLSPAFVRFLKATEQLSKAEMERRVLWIGSDGALEQSLSPDTVRVRETGVGVGELCRNESSLLQGGFVVGTSSIGAGGKDQDERQQLFHDSSGGSDSNATPLTVVLSSEGKAYA